MNLKKLGYDPSKNRCSRLYQHFAGCSSYEFHARSGLLAPAIPRIYLFLFTSADTAAISLYKVYCFATIIIIPWLTFSLVTESLVHHKVGTRQIGLSLWLIWASLRGDFCLAVRFYYSKYYESQLFLLFILFSISFSCSLLCNTILF